jgi:NAD(P)-dependent dehydrogenase (short-subunit alcohol dehydrogenase family)
MNPKVAIVTGGTRGIGRAIVETLLHHNANVVFIYKNSKNIANEICAKFSSAQAVQADVTNEKDIQKVLAVVKKSYTKLDYLINNAGINFPGSIETLSLSDWNKFIQTNLTSIFLFSKYCIPLLSKSENANIINIASRHGLSEFSEEQYIPYSVSKAGVINFTAGLSRELKNMNIRVNAIIPTPTKTDLFSHIFSHDDEIILSKKGKLGKPEDVAELVTQILSDKNMNGQIVIDKRIYL